MSKKEKKKKRGKKEKKVEEAVDKEECEKESFDPRSEYLKRVCDVRTSSQRSGRVVSVVRALSATEAERIEDRLGAFNSYGQKGDLHLMDQLFRLGSRYREAASSGVDSRDAGEMKIDESVILKTLMDGKIGNLEKCRLLTDCIYGKRTGASDRVRSRIEKRLLVAACVLMNGRSVILNAGQSRALEAYADAAGPRVFCILSPPGSGKTTVAATMTAEVARRTAEARSKRLALRKSNSSLEEHGRMATRAPEVRSPDEEKGLQLLLSVQNVAVDNMGAALKKMNYGGGEVYNMKSTMKLDPKCPAPFDFLDLLDEATLKKWRDGTMSLVRKVKIHTKKDQDRKEVRSKYNDDKPKYEEKKMSYEEALTFDRREYEGKISPKILLSTVEMVLQKMYGHGNMCGALKRVSRVIIDEASLLTEAALFCIIRRFPEARIVLIGDDHQLPPFMYDEKILGQELAGRAALSVAMKTGRVPVVELNEVYRAPPSLVAPYNRLAYGGRLVSKKAEGAYPLSEIGLIHSELPQLLLIDVDGMQERNEKTMSLYNLNEIKALKSLLSKFPSKWTNEIMIICLYKEQKKRVQSALDKNYSVLTVDSAQGKEKSIVILMTTRTVIPKTGSFFDSYERCNVSVSRQQKALIILGKASLLITKKPWSTVVNGDDFSRIKAEDIK